MGPRLCNQDREAVINNKPMKFKAIGRLAFMLLNNALFIAGYSKDDDVAVSNP